ncbi:MAG TPA: fasciclin [Planktothrix sp. UBA8407]|jgi:Secreted and surface protein containing fasciclin-like repeats|nr:fasciclin [Planktothrix sp. UBA8402]HAO12719.1 fasciclin [Planktothrix sp. UBA8407]HBK24085.1 fasciclin [Planktothrix sp. UBA10369]
MNNLIENQTQGKSLGIISILSLLTLGTISPAVAAEVQMSANSELICRQPSQDLAQIPISPKVIQGVVGDLATVILSDERFKILGMILQSIGLLDALKQGDFTIFAPTDEALAKLPQQILDAILKSQNLNRFTELLEYHVIPGKITTTDLKSGKLKTLEGDSVTIKTKKNQIKVGNATIIDSDIPASNGVIHVIDQILILPQ